MQTWGMLASAIGQQAHMHFEYECEFRLDHHDQNNLTKFSATRGKRRVEKVAPTCQK